MDSKGKIVKSTLWAVGSLLIAELICRICGLHEVPVYVKNEEYEYIYAPSQDCNRWFKRILVNEHSMRSKELSEQDEVRILKLGDSVINGGSHIDHEELSSTLLENRLSSKSGKVVRVLNVSANSWGPDNALGYLNEHGHFDATMLVLVFSGHDLHDNMHFRNVVGEHKQWPSSQPVSALWYGLKYVAGGLLDGEPNYAYMVGHDDSTINPGWQGLFEYARKNELELLVYVHAEKTEVLDQQFATEGQELIEMLDKSKFRYINGLESGEKVAYYRDNIHINKQGHDHLANVLFKDLLSHTLGQ